tara:strand:- start:2301 stop:3128 length:828 start_codon:yes stop_codon:yes gene_type:complete
MTFNSYLNLDNKNYRDIIDYYLIYLSEFSNNDFPYGERLQLRGSASKFVNCIYAVTFLKQEKQDEYFELIDKFNEISNDLRRRENQSRLAKYLFSSSNSYQLKEEFEKIYIKTLDIISDTNKTLDLRSRYLEINDLYKPDNSNKSKIKKLIIEAIELIIKDDSLTEKTKKQLVDYLNKVLANLDYENTNWTDIIGKITETIIILGALGSIVGGFSPLFEAKEKLKETTEVIEKTSINLNYKVINETFILSEIKNINSNSSFILQLEENNESVDKN